MLDSVGLSAETDAHREIVPAGAEDEISDALLATVHYVPVAAVVEYEAFELAVAIEQQLHYLAAQFTLVSAIVL